MQFTRFPPVAFFSLFNSVKPCIAGAIAWRETATSRWQFVTICFIIGLAERIAMCSCNRPYDCARDAYIITQEYIFARGMTSNSKLPATIVAGLLISRTDTKRIISVFQSEQNVSGDA